MSGLRTYPLSGSTAMALGLVLGPVRNISVRISVTRSMASTLAHTPSTQKSLSDTQSTARSSGE